jgi:hypothetical protein
MGHSTLGIGKGKGREIERNWVNFFDPFGFSSFGHLSFFLENLLSSTRK